MLWFVILVFVSVVVVVVYSVGVIVFLIVCGFEIVDLLDFILSYF